MPRKKNEPYCLGSLHFFAKGNKLGFATYTSSGKRKMVWLGMPESVRKIIDKYIEAEVAEKDEEARMTPQQLQDKYAEMMGT